MLIVYVLRPIVFNQETKRLVTRWLCTVLLFSVSFGCGISVMVLFMFKVVIGCCTLDNKAKQDIKKENFIPSRHACIKIIFPIARPI